MKLEEIENLKYFKKNIKNIVIHFLLLEENAIVITFGN